MLEVRCVGDWHLLRELNEWRRAGVGSRRNRCEKESKRRTGDSQQKMHTLRVKDYKKNGLTSSVTRQGISLTSVGQDISSNWTSRAQAIFPFEAQHAPVWVGRFGP